MKQLDITNREIWRAWLAENHQKENEIWLVFYKKESGHPSLAYESAVEESLCYGWIDSLIKKIDDQKYARKFTPRSAASLWSESNKKRIKKLIEQGRMTEHGLKLIQAAQKSGCWDQAANRPEISPEIPAELLQALEQNAKAKVFFDQLAPTYQKQFSIWISLAKRPQTREKRLRESLTLLERGEKLGLK